MTLRNAGQARSLSYRLLAMAIGAGVVFATLTLWSQADEKKPDDKKPDAPAAPLTETRVIERVNTATDKALDWLESKQIKQGEGAGAWRIDNQAVNALAVLAFLSSGHTPGRGKYGDVIEDGAVKPGVLTRGKKFILSKARPDGYLAIGGGRMYEHGLTTLALSEMYGMDPDPDLEDKLRKAVNLLVGVQGDLGGWNYEPNKADGDLSVSVMQIVALRAANNAGIPLAPSVITKAGNYIHDRANPTGVGFGYMSKGGAQTPQTSAAGVLCLQLLNQPDDPQVGKTLDYLSTVRVEWGPTEATYFYYFHYYAIQAFYQAGGKHWNEWHPKIRELLLSKQNPDGSWDVPPNTQEVSVDATNKVYSTALATLILNIYRHYLPAYQR